MIPATGLVLVTPVETAETLPGGKILIPEDARSAFAKAQMEVLAVGAPERCEDEDCLRAHGCRICIDRNEQGGQHWQPDHDPELARCHPIPRCVEPGSWVLVAHRAPIRVQDYPRPLYVVRQRDVIAVITQT